MRLIRSRLPLVSYPPAVSTPTPAPPPPPSIISRISEQLIGLGCIITGIVPVPQAAVVPTPQAAIVSAHEDRQQLQPGLARYGVGRPDAVAPSPAPPPPSQATSPDLRQQVQPGQAHYQAGKPAAAAPVDVYVKPVQAVQVVDFRFVLDPGDSLSDFFDVALEPSPYVPACIVTTEPRRPEPGRVAYASGLPIAIAPAPLPPRPVFVQAELFVGPAVTGQAHPGMVLVIQHGAPDPVVVVTPSYAYARIGQIYTPGPQLGRVYTPGPHQGQVYTPGPRIGKVGP